MLKLYKLPGSVMFGRLIYVIFSNDFCKPLETRVYVLNTDGEAKSWSTC